MHIYADQDLMCMCVFAVEFYIHKFYLRFHFGAAKRDQFMPKSPFRSTTVDHNSESPLLKELPRRSNNRFQYQLNSIPIL